MMKMIRQVLVVIILCCSTSCVYSQAFEAHKIIIMLEADESWAAFEKQIDNISILNSDNITTNNWLVEARLISKSLNIGTLQLHENITERLIIDEMNRLPQVKAVALNYFAKYRSTPNDNLYQQQWNMDIIDAPKAWDFSTGGITANGDTIVIFLIDEGIDLSHEDLAENIFTNNAEIPNNGIDDDNNNYIDDYQGWYLTSDSDNHVPATHGVGVAGIIGARGNNQVGISGVNWQVKILPFSIIESQLTAENIIKAYDYALEMRKKYDATNGVEGAYIVATNLSAGFQGRFPNSFPFFCEIYDTLGNQGILSVTATGNNENTNVELVGDVPTLCDSDFLITVTDTDSFDVRKGAAGQNTVDLAAPGNGCFTTAPIDRYRYFSGTSCATPHVTGTVALLYSLNNDLFANQITNNKVSTALQIRSFILENTDKIDGLDLATVTGGRLNIGKAVTALNSYYQGFNEEFKVVNFYPNPVDNLLTITYETPDIDNFELLIFNTIGQLVTSKKYAVEELALKEIKFDFSNYESGLYFLMLKNGEEFEIVKIVVY